MKKNKGMKIYKQRKKRKGGNNQIVSILGTCAVVFGVGIFGYYVVAVPIYDLISTSDKKQEASSIVETSDTETTTVTTYKKIFEDLDLDKVTEASTAVSTAPVTEVTTVSTEKVTTEAPVTTILTEEIPVEVTTQAPAVPVSSEVKGGCYYLSTDDISSVSALVDKLNNIGDCSSVVVPLKTTGGSVNYSSSIDSARLSGAVSSDVSLYDIVSVITKKGLTPIAEISTISDNIYPETYKKSAYQFADGYTGEWLDNRAEDGGKPWLSPFSSVTIEYLSSLVNEITASGIKNIICTDTCFPPFREKDLGYIGEIVQSETRYKGLTDLINTLDDAAAANGGRVMLSVSAPDVMNSSSEVFRPEEFGSMPAVVSINMNDFSGENLSAVLNKIADKTGSMKVVPCLIADSVTESALSTAENTFKASGYDFYVFK